VRRLLALERRTLELVKEFPPPPSSLPDNVDRFVQDLRLAAGLIVLYHHEGFSETNDRLQEVLKSVGLPEILTSNFNVQGVADAFYKELDQRTTTALRALVEARGGKRPNDQSNALLTLYHEVPTKLKTECGLPTEFAEFSRREAALFRDKTLPYGADSKQTKGVACEPSVSPEQKGVERNIIEFFELMMAAVHASSRN
jgi:hypothetical protein